MAQAPANLRAALAGLSDDQLITQPTSQGCVNAEAGNQ
jgi:hypothetical protein